MKNTLLNQVNDLGNAEQQKNHLRANIKSLQRDLIKASFKQSSTPGSYSDLLQAINIERAKLKKLNQ
ncbi:hypothetical protein MNBD_GAMMA02-1420 [hydrothermal vent metagenome]|uniref:Uncharacterized protein n=1 Tax=hydrothermal vent metagenome TaxID=652676 RepID=A0A3B0VL89_9ZZZZ